MKEIKKVIKRLVVPSGKKISLKDYDPKWTAHIKDEKTASSLLADGVKHLAKAQEKLYARDTHSVLMIFQAMDAAGKDGTIRHVMSGINPQGCQVFNFKAPSAEERDHTYLWRSMKALPERGRFGIHNRSYYEEVLVSRVHPEIIEGQQLPDHLKDKEIFERRYREINNFERYLTDNGMIILKFFLHVSKDEQKRRFLSRIDEENKNWKLSVNDARERGYWDDYMRAYEAVFTHTSTKAAPWHIIPANHKWFTRLAVAGIVYSALEKLDLSFPKVTDAKRKELLEVKRLLMAEKD